jgi:hypothetical protein
VAAYAVYLGFDLALGPRVAALAQEALLAPLPPGWTAHLDAAGAEYFCALGSGRTSYEHPLDEHYRRRYAALAAELAGAQRAPGAG